MISLELTAHEGHVKVKFDVPDKPEDKIRLDDIAAFNLHLDLIKHRLTELTNQAVGKGEGYDLKTTEDIAKEMKVPRSA